MKDDSLGYVVVTTLTIGFVFGIAFTKAITLSNAQAIGCYEQYPGLLDKKGSLLTREDNRCLYQYKYNLKIYKNKLEEKGGR